MKRFLRSKLVLSLVAIVMIAPVGAYTVTIGATSSNPNITLGSLDITVNVLSPAPSNMKMPWNYTRTDVTYNSGPHGKSLNTVCQLEPRKVLSGLDFGMPQN